MNISSKIKKILGRLPDEPGIYLFYNEEKKLVYVGKATSLKSRVRSYFSGMKSPRPIEIMIHEVVDIKYKQTDSVLEAIILEANWIKKNQPKYNVLNKDDKTWNYITIGNEEYPIVGTMRQHEYNQMVNSKQQIVNSKFKNVFGPYPGLNTKAAMKLLNRLFHISHCRDRKHRGQNKQSKLLRSCLYRQMGQCLGVCDFEISVKDYRNKVIRPLVTFLRGGKKRLVSQIERDMKKAAKVREYEDAARLRDQLKALYRIQDIALLNKSFFKKQLENNTEQIPKIEGYDISNLGSTGMVGSMVVFVDGEADKSQYRKFKIKGVKQQSDVDCLEEVLTRRLKHDEWSLPDVFMIDGGKPQVNRVLKVLKANGVSVPVVGIAKGAERKKNEIIIGRTKYENYEITKFLDYGEFVKWVYENTDVLICVRDEAHRFAISFQRSLRRIKR